MRRVIRRGAGSLGAAAALLALASACARPEAARTDPRPNLIVFLSDALRASNLPAYGYRRIETPNLDRFRAESVRFANHYAAYPGTPISVSQLFSGRLVPPLLMDYSFALAPVRAITGNVLVLPAKLQRMGYLTGIVSSHPWFNKRARVLSSFEEQVLVRPPRPGSPYASLEDLQPGIESFLRRASRSERPFFLYVHAMDTHSPYLSGGRFAPTAMNPTLRDRYDASIRWTDDWFGRTMELLDDLGLSKNSIVAFTSDHGEELGELGPEWWNRDHGATLREAQLKVPFLLRLPGGEGAGSDRETLSTHLDVAPTLLSFVDPEIDLSRFVLDGRNLAPDLSGGELSGCALAFTWRYWACFDRRRSVVLDQWRDEVHVVRYEVNEDNYAVPVEEADVDAATRDGASLRAERAQRLAEFVDSRPDDSLLDGIPIGVPTIHLAGDVGFGREADDGRWWQKDVRVLEASPFEEVAPLVVSTPWSPGEYRIWIRLDPGLGPGSGCRIRFRTATGSWSEPVQVRRGGADEKGWFDLGRRRLGTMLEVEYSQVVGGMRTFGFYLSRGAPEGDAGTDDGLEGDLRALGYVG